MTFTDKCNSNAVNEWLKKSLLPEIPKGTTIIMDNASFHKRPETRKIIENAGCFLKYLPTYSPDLNPIEHCWHKIKSWLRPFGAKDAGFKGFSGEGVAGSLSFIMEITISTYLN